MPGTDEGLDQLVSRQAPLTGLVEGLVYDLTGNRRTLAADVPVAIDGSRLTRTDERGRYSFADVPEGPHRVSLALDELPAKFEPGPIYAADAVVQARKSVRADGRFCFYNVREGDCEVELDPATLPAETRLVPAPAVPVAFRLAGGPPRIEFLVEAQEQERRIRRVFDLDQTPAKAK